MLTFRKMWENDEQVAYEYYPEGKEDKGIIIYHKESGTCIFELLPDSDSAKIYAGMLLSRLHKYAKENSYDDSGMVACW